MATLLGSATLSTAFTSNIDSTVITDDLNRVTTTEYRDPITVHIQGEGVIDTRDYRAIYLPGVANYIDKDYFDTGYVFDDPVFSAGFATGGTSELLKIAYDFLDIDPTATISSVDVKIDFEPTEALGSDPDYGTLQMAFLHLSATDPQSATQTITSGDRQTMTFTIPATGTWPISGLGEKNTVKLTASGNFKAMRIYRLQARVNYTGRTRFTTGFKSYTTKSVLDFIPGTDTNPPPIPTEATRLYKTEGYGFAIPSDHVVDGVGMLYGFGAVVDGTYKESLHFKRDISGTHTRISTNEMPRFFGGFLSGGEANVYARLVNTQDVDNSGAAITTAEVNDSTFGLEGRFAYEFTSTRPSEPVVFDINIAYVGPIASGDITMNTVSTVTATPVMTHGNTADEIDDFTTAVSVSALGGFLLEATATIPTATTTTVGTAGLTRTGFTVAMSASFTVPDTTTEFAITATSFIFPSASVSCSAGVTFTTPATSSSAFTTTPGTAIGMIRTGFTIAVPSAFTTPALSDVLLVKAPNDKQVYTTPLDTRTHIIPQDARTIALETETRTYIIPEDDRTHELEQETRITTPEALQ